MNSKFKAALFALALVGSPEVFQGWAEDRLTDLRRDFERTDRKVSDYNAERRDLTRETLSNLKERVSRAEGRLEQVGEERDADSQKAREEIRAEIEDVRDDFNDVQRSLRPR